MLVFTLLCLIFKPLNSLFWLGWLSFDLLTFTIQLFLVFCSCKLFLSKNVYELLLWAFISITSFVFCLFFYQLDVFACFLLVSESVVIFFILTFIIHVNHTNINLSYRGGYLLLSVILVSCAFVFFVQDVNVYSYYLDWYSSQLSSFNDLLAQYIYIYQLNYYLTVIIGFWLLLLTFFLVIILSVSDISTNWSNYFFKRQDLWKQWYSKPFIKFFK